MGLKSKATKYKLSLVDEHSDDAYSSNGENVGSEDNWPLSPLQEGECSATSKDVDHISNNSNIEVVQETNNVATINDELEGATIVPPLSTLCILKLVKLLNQLGKKRILLLMELPTNRIESI